MRARTGYTATCRRSGRRKRGAGPCLGAVILWSVVMVCVGWPGNAAAAARVRADFNGDGFADLAIGIPYEDIGGIEDAGAVQVLYGSPSGLRAAGNQVWHQDSPDIVDVAERWDNFGAALTAGDFNGDGVADLAIGIPYEDIGGIGNAGAVQVLYGSLSGLRAAGNQLWHQDSTSIFRAAQIVDVAEWDDHFGAALTAGDFNGDGVADLAIGVPGEAIVEDGWGEDAWGAGAVQVLYGWSGFGLVGFGNQFWHQDSPGILGEAAAYFWEQDYFGAVLAAGDFNGDGADDLAIGIPYEDEWVAAIIYDNPGSGAVQVLYGSPSGLQAVGNQVWHQDSPGILDVTEWVDNPGGEQFGAALTAGDFNDDGVADLAIGVPAERVAAPGGNEGAVHILYGSAVGGLNGGTLGNQFWHQDTSGIQGVAAALDYFGTALTAGDFNGDGVDDLAIGVPGEAFGERSFYDAAGAVHVLYGSAIGLRSTGNQYWHQDTSGIVDFAEANDRFGAALTAGDFNGDGVDDLAIGVPGEDIGSIMDAGWVQIIFGSAGGLTSDGDQVWHQNVPTIMDSAEQGDRFARSLSQ